MFFIDENQDITKNLHAGSGNEVDAMDEQHALEVRFAKLFSLERLARKMYCKKSQRT
jgi:hypothetical protein